MMIQDGQFSDEDILELITVDPDYKAGSEVKCGVLKGTMQST